MAAQVPTKAPEEHYDYLYKVVLIGDSGVGKSNLLSRFARNEFSTEHNNKTTVGVEFATRIVDIGGKRIKSLPPGGNLVEIHIEACCYRLSFGILPDKNAIGLLEVRKFMTASFPATLPVLHLDNTLFRGTAFVRQSRRFRYQRLTRFAFSYYRGALGAMLVYDLSDANTFNHADDWLQEFRKFTEDDVVIMLVGNKSDLAQEHRAVTAYQAQTYAERKGLLFMETSARDTTFVESAFLSLLTEISQTFNFKVQNAQTTSASNSTNPPPVKTLTLINNEDDEKRGCC
ncbi:hypothetical protein RvY_00687 [Ramazzottius varieornatus]|uniref:Uncharacterized protein n=1 Tax=Ramazzottius varieornatus TaxID=947166 RepID=A0A1D1UDN5_RAMVA|nr:hypothetical protein RvY_00687 [Ramazzottius varieornatus]